MNPSPAGMLHSSTAWGQTEAVGGDTSSLASTARRARGAPAAPSLGPQLSCRGHMAPARFPTWLQVPRLRSQSRVQGWSWWDPRQAVRAPPLSSWPVQEQAGLCS